MLHLEALWALNSWVDCCVLWMVGRFLHQAPRWRRFFFVTTVSTFFHVGMIVANLSPLVEVILLVLMSAGIVIFTFTINGLAQLTKACLLLWGSSSAVGGVMYVIKRLFSDTPFQTYFDQSFGMLILLSAVIIGTVVCVSKVVESLQMKHIGETFTYQVEIIVNGQAWKGFGFLDSGNHVVDPFTKSPVVFADTEVAAELLPNFIADSLTDHQFLTWPEFWQKKVRMIPSRTVHSSSQMMIGIMCDQVTCSVNGQEYSLSNVPVVFTKQSLLFEEKCNCLLNPLQLLPCHQI